MARLTPYSGALNNFAKTIAQWASFANLKPDDTDSFTDPNASSETIGDTYLLRQFRERNVAAEKEHNVGLVDILPNLRDATVVLSALCIRMTHCNARSRQHDRCPAAHTAAAYYDDGTLPDALHSLIAEERVVPRELLAHQFLVVLKWYAPLLHRPRELNPVIFVFGMCVSLLALPRVLQRPSDLLVEQFALLLPNILLICRKSRRCKDGCAEGGENELSAVRLEVERHHAALSDFPGSVTCHRCDKASHDLRSHFT